MICKSYCKQWYVCRIMLKIVEFCTYHVCIWSYMVWLREIIKESSYIEMHWIHWTIWKSKSGFYHRLIELEIHPTITVPTIWHLNFIKNLITWIFKQNLLIKRPMCSLFWNPLNIYINYTSLHVKQIILPNIATVSKNHILGKRSRKSLTIKYHRKGHTFLPQVHQTF